MIAAGQKVVWLDLLCAPGPLHELAELTENLLLAHELAGHRATPGDVPHNIIGEQGVQGCHVPITEGLVPTSQLLDVGPPVESLMMISS